LLEPGPVALPTTARHGRDNLMTLSRHMMVEFTPPLVACSSAPPTSASRRCARRGDASSPFIANFERRATDTRFVNRYSLFVLEAPQAWIDPAQRDAKTIHHRGYGAFAVDGETIRLKSAKP